jgi:lipoprotein-anchoring transpeptidase ErfK/SrfK
MKPASELLKKPKGPIVNKQNEALVTPDNSRVLISLSKQRVYLMTDDTVYIDSPISSGKAGHSTPTGSFTVLEKDPNHKSNIYGSFVDSAGRTVRSGISSKIDSAPSGTHYVGAPMKWFMRLTDKGVGMHVGILPGYPASHGCVRLPETIAPLIYQKVKIGTPVVIEQ